MSLEKKNLICSSTTNPRKLAVAITKELEKTKSIKIKVIGANAVNQAIKAVCYVNQRKQLFNGELPVFVYPNFCYAQVGENKVQTLISLEVR
jgi:stage V sporulation protein SpoVS